MLWPYPVSGSSSYEWEPGAAGGATPTWAGLGPTSGGQAQPHLDVVIRTWALAQIFRECKSSKSLHLQEPLLLSSGSEENSFHLEWLLGD